MQWKMAHLPRLRVKTADNGYYEVILFAKGN